MRDVASAREACSREVRFGPLTLGPGRPPLIWPDIDVYFKRDLTLAHRLVDAIAESGTGCLKLAALHDPEICLPGTYPVEYFIPGQGMHAEPYRAVVERHTVGLNILAELIAQGRRAGLVIILSLYDHRGLDFALAQQVDIIKIPSSNIVHQPLIQAAAQTPLPLVLDTGRSTLAEIARAVDWARSGDPRRPLLIQHSQRAAPAPAEQGHLRMLSTLQGIFGCPVGLSDHAIGIDAALAAVALGACVIEKGVVADASAPDIDVSHALPISQLRDMRLRCEEIWRMLGQPMRPSSEIGPRPADRMGLIAAAAIQGGERLGLNNIGFAHPTIGIPVEHFNRVQNGIAAGAIAQGKPIEWSDVILPP